MIGIAGLVLAAAIGVDYGWEKTPDGEVEYIIQISPEQLDSLREGEEITSFIPPEASKVTCFKVQIGTGNLPHETVLTPHGPREVMPAAGFNENHPPTLRPGQMNVNDRSTWGGDNFVQSQPNGNNMLAPPNNGLNNGTVNNGLDPYHYQRPNTGSNFTHDPNLTNRQASIPSNTTTAGTFNNNSAFRTTPTTTTLPTMGTVNRTMQPQEQPWLPLLLTGTALFLSLGGNAYLGWIAAEFYTRYRDTVERMRAERRY